MTTRAPIEIWHRRLAYLGYDNIKKLAHISEGLETDGSAVPDCVCQYYAESMQTATQSRALTPRTSNKLDLIHSDVGGPFTLQS